MRMRICLIGMFNNIINSYSKKNHKKYVEVILIDQLYNDLKSMVTCKTAKDCQDYIKEFINFYDIKDK